MATSSRTVKKGVRRSRGGFGVLIASGVVLGVGVGLQPLSFEAGLGFNIAGLGLLGTGIGLSVSGKRRQMMPRRFANVGVAPTMLRAPGGSKAYGMSLTGRF